VIFTCEEIARFWAKVNFDGPIVAAELGPCWVWTGSVDKDYFKTHRISFSLENGPVADGVLTCHKCDNRPCVRPSHLFAGDALANALDMRVKGRGVDNSGERHGLSKLSGSDVLQIKRLLGFGLPNVEIANAYGIDRSYVSHIKSGRAWSHL
jgi:hypothetical protein